MSNSANAEKNRRRMKQLRRLIFARQSMTLVIAGCDFVLDSTPSEYLRANIAAGLATLYASPFTTANELGQLEDEFSRFADPVHAATHWDIMIFRNKLYGHRDLTATGTRVTDGLIAPMHFITVEITHQGTATTAGSLIQWPNEAFSKAQSLGIFQRDRLLKKEIKLMRQLAQHAKKPPGTYRLGVDFP